MSDDRILAELTGMRGEMTDMRGELTGLKTGQATILTELGSVRVELGSVRVELGSVRMDLGSARTELDQVKTAQGLVKSELDRVRGDVMARIDRVADKVNAMHEDVVVAFGSAEQVRRNHDRIREELHAWQNMVGSMQQRLMALDARVSALEGKT